MERGVRWKVFPPRWRVETEVETEGDFLTKIIRSDFDFSIYGISKGTNTQTKVKLSCSRHLSFMWLPKVISQIVFSKYLRKNVEKS